ncbi:hypothetical protein VRRI112168_03715 [Vreelandella rituensis]|uniref:Uncharacterized protein n=1 Tax=Vreelandella rituensis TaxID=2282306 RepID=A0A368U967_9GAMM|nr:hypothetical protein [Halomonas rituensis]RCV93758.1 hypothetical protein DU506_00975 [Halomonas rituensis]
MPGATDHPVELLTDFPVNEVENSLRTFLHRLAFARFGAYPYPSAKLYVFRLPDQGTIHAENATALHTTLRSLHDMPGFIEEINGIDYKDRPLEDMLAEIISAPEATVQKAVSNPDLYKLPHLWAHLPESEALCCLRNLLELMRDASSNRESKHQRIRVEFDADLPWELFVTDEGACVAVRQETDPEIPDTYITMPDSLSWFYQMTESLPARF